MCRVLLAFVFSVMINHVIGQVPNLKPSGLRPLNFSRAGEEAFNNNTPNGSFHNLGRIRIPRIDTTSSGKVDTVYDEVVVRDYENYWDVLMPGCSWYCGGRVTRITASSVLPNQGQFTYEAENVGDFSYKTAWVEGANGIGIGEYVEYEFASESARIHEVKIANGYVKSDKAYTENSRVKRLKLYYNNKVYAILNLKDQRAEQVFTVGPFGFEYYKLDDDKKPVTPWTLRFEILEVYPGTRHADTAISEIHFMGYDGH